MKRIWVRIERPDDRAKVNEWLINGNRNYFDPDCMNYPATTMLVAHHTDTVVAMPVQTVFLLESLAVNPSVTNHEVAVGLKEIISNLVLQGIQRGIGEIYFLGTNEQTNAIARKNDFEELPWKAYRLKIPRLGEDNESLSKSSA